MAKAPHQHRRPARSQEGPEERCRRHRPRPRFVQQHDHHDHRSPRRCRCLGHPSGGQGFKGSRKSTPFAAQVAAEDGWPRCSGARHQEPGRADQGPGPGSRVVGARIGCARHPHQLDLGRDAGAAQRLPSAEASPHLIVSRKYNPTSGGCLLRIAGLTFQTRRRCAEATSF